MTFGGHDGGLFCAKIVHARPTIHLCPLSNQTDQVAQLKTQLAVAQAKADEKSGIIAQVFRAVTAN